MGSAYPAALDTFVTKVNGPDQIIDADHINDPQDAIVAIETELGTDPAGSAVDLKTRLAVRIANDGKLKEPQQLVTVGKTNADYTTIQSAIDAITDASASKVYTVLVYPGVYAENVTLKNYVSLIGIDNWLAMMSQLAKPIVQIDPASGIPLTIPDNANCHFKNLYLKGSSATSLDFEGYAYVNAENSWLTTASNTNPTIQCNGQTLACFKNCLIENSDYTYDALLNNTGVWAPLLLEFIHCNITGNIDVTEASGISFTLYLTNTYLSGQITNTIVPIIASIFSSSLNGQTNGAPLYLAATNGATVYISHSQLKAASGLYTIARSDGAGTIALTSNHCAMTHTFGPNVIDAIAAPNNVLDTDVQTTFPFM